MNTDRIEDVLSWLKTTDLVEVAYKDASGGFAFATSESLPQPSYPAPACRFEPVVSPGVGLFRPAALGKGRAAEEGAAVKAGDLLGLVDARAGEPTPVKAPVSGRLAKVFIEDNAPVEYGQVLMFVEPA